MKPLALGLIATGLAAVLPLACASAAGSSTPGGPRPTSRAEAPSAAGADLPSLEFGSHTFQRRLLANGLVALAVADQEDNETASVFVVVGAGTGQEGAGETGLAHLVEHAMYAGTAAVGAGEHDAIVKELGGESNAFTRQDYTLYYDHLIPRDAVERVLSLESDRLRGLTFSEEAVLHERWRLEVEERHSSLDVELQEFVESVAFRVHPYGAGVRDAEGHTLAPRLRVADVRAFYDRWYHPNRTAVVVVGGDPESSLDAIEAAFGSLPAGPPPEPQPVEPETARGGEARFLTELTAERVVHAWVLPPAAGAGRQVRRSLATAARLVETDGVGAALGGRRGPELFTLQSTGAEADALLASALSALLEGAFEDDAFERAEDGGTAIAELTLRGRPYLSLAAEVGVLAATDRLQSEEDETETTRDDVLRVARQWLDPERRWTVRFLPTETPEGEAQEPLPEDPQELMELAQRADSSGDLARAIAAYEKLLAAGPNRMNTVIYLYSNGDLRRRSGDLLGAQADLKRALEVVDYPAVRELLEVVEQELEGGAVTLVREDDPAGSTEAAAEPEVGRGPARGVHIFPKGEIDAAWIDQAETILAEIEAWRGLEFLQDVTVELVAEDAAPDKLRGWYEPETDRLVVVDGAADTFARGTFLHELVHALQDQHFDLASGRPEPDTDAARAYEPLGEGEAMLAVSELMDYDFEQHTALPEDGELDEERYLKIFHYGAGLRFVRALREAGGWAQVDQAYAEPPPSTSAVLHPDRFLAGLYPLETGLADELLGFNAGTLTVRGEYELALLLARDPSTRADSARVAGRLAADLELGAGFLDTEKRLWTLRFFDSIAAETCAGLLSARGFGIKRVSDVDVGVVLPPETETAEQGSDS